MGHPTLSRRAVNAQLKKSGAARVPAKVAKGILDRIRAMTTDERADAFNLQALGLTPAQAKALAMTGAGKAPKRIPRYKADVAKMGPTLAEVHAPAPGGQVAPRVDRKVRRKAKRLKLLGVVTKGGPGSGPHPGGGKGGPALSADSHIDAAGRHMERAKQARAAGDHENAAKHVAFAQARLGKALGASQQRLAR